MRTNFIHYLEQTIYTNNNNIIFKQGGERGIDAVISAQIVNN